MDGFSLIIGGTIGILAGWAFSNASTKQREASRKQRKASKAKEELTQKESEMKSNEESSFSDALQGVLFYALGICLILMMGFILFGSAF